MFIICTILDAPKIGIKSQILVLKIVLIFLHSNSISSVYFNKITPYNLNFRLYFTHKKVNF